MDEISIPHVITAIGDAEFESFVASTLYGQGWSVTFRALNFDSLSAHLTEMTDQKVILIYSPDLPGLTPEKLNSLDRRCVRTFGFASSQPLTELFPEVLDRPQSPLELISHIRGSIRAPMMRTPTSFNAQSRRAKVIGIGSFVHATGATTFAINAAFEASLAGKKTLIIDANNLSPSIAILLDERELTLVDSWKNISPLLFACEANQKNLSDLLAKIEMALSEFDLIILDLGSLQGLSSQLNDRRWGSQLVSWCADRADHIYVVTHLDSVAISRLREFKTDLESTTIAAKINFVLNGRSSQKRDSSSGEAFSHALGAQYSHKVVALPFDPRSVELARIKKSPLEQVNERGTLRRAIARFVQQEFCS
jgi:Mrp family chromosome partitioning ATPase